MKTNKSLLLLRTVAFLVILLFCSHQSKAATVTIKFFLQGFYIGGGQMNSPLFNSGLTLNPDEMDFVTIRLLDPVTRQLFESADVLAYTDGNCTAQFSNNIVGNSYYIEICHRNTLPTMSSSPIAFSSITDYDFSDDQIKAYSNKQIEVEPGVWAFYSGDINHDCVIDSTDYDIMYPDILNFIAGYVCTDINGDGVVDFLDEILLSSNMLLNINCNLPLKVAPCLSCLADDGNLCTNDFVDPNTGAITHIYVDIDDGINCTNDNCDPSTGLITHSPKYSAAQLDDNLICTMDFCDEPTGLISHVIIPGCTDCACDSGNMTTSILVNTGFNTNTGTALNNNGEPDMNWTLVNQPSWSNLDLPIHPPTIYYNPNNNPNIPFTNSQWISPFPSGSSPDNITGNPFTFEFAFCVCDDDSITFDFHSLADDSIGFYLDNYLVAFPYQSITVTGQQAGQMNYHYKIFVPKGRHYFRADLRNAGGPLGLDVSGSISGKHLVKNGHCTSDFSIVELGNDITACSGSDITLSATGCQGIITWEEIIGGNSTLLPNTASSITVHPTQTSYYKVTCCDAQNCCSSDSILVIIDNSLELLVDAYDAPICGGLGGFSFTPSGGDAPYTITTSPCPVAGYPCSFNNITNSFSTLSKYPAGIYTIYITDNNGCTDSVVVTIKEPDPHTISVTAISPVCCGSNGSFNVTIAGGQAPYTIRVFTNTTPYQLIVQTYSGINGNNFTSPADFETGTYQVYVIDANGCSSFALLTISNPPDCITAHAIIEPATCNPCNGKISAFATGGTPFNVNNLVAPYQISITELTNNTPYIDPSSGDIFGNPYYEYANQLCAGDFLIVAIDANGCVDSEIVVVPSVLPQLSLIPPLAVCKNDTPFTITATPPGGTFTGTNNCISSSGLFNPSNAIIGMNTITYSYCGSTTSKTIKVVDCGECGLCYKPGQELVYDGKFELAFARNPQKPFFDTGLSYSNSLCTSQTKGRFAITNSSSNYCIESGNRRFKNVNGHGGANSAYMLINGANIMVNSIWKQRVYNIHYRSNYQFSFWINTSIRKADTGLDPEIVVAINKKVVFSMSNIKTNGGWMEFAIDWIAPNITSVEIEIFQRDTNLFTIKDYVYGIDDISFRECISAGPKLELGPDRFLIQGNSTFISPVINSQVGIFKYIWYPGPFTTRDITVQPTSSTNYILTVIDSNGCFDKDEALVTVGKGTASIEHAMCFGESSGSIQINDWIGVPPHTYLWSNGATSSNLTNLSAGTYVVTATDSLGIITTDSFTVLQPDPITAIWHDGNSCSDAATGFLELEVSGGTAPYNYLWNDSSTTPFIYNIPAGTYSVNISDTNGCTSAQLSYSIQSTGDCLANCCGEGFIPKRDTIFSFNAISTIESDLTQSSLCSPGTYYISDNAQNKCSTLDSITDNFTGADNYLIVQGSTLPNKKVWKTMIHVNAGSNYYYKGYLHLKLDANQPATQICMAADSLIIACYDSLVVTDVDEWFEFSNCFQATETDSIEFSIIQPGTGGAFGIDEIEFHECVPITPITVTTLPPFTVCPGDVTDTINIYFIGDYPPHEIIWDDGFIGPVRTDLPVGTYPFTIIDVIGTTVSDSVIVTEINTIPGPITGTHSSGCYPAVNTNATYSIPALSGAAYLWNVPSGMTITGGQGTNTLNVSIAGSAINNGINSSICVAATTSCGTNSICSKLNINSVKPVQPGSISGNTKVCPGETIVCSVAAVARTNFYEWSLPTGMTIASGSGTNIITVAIDSSFTGGTISLTANNSCGISNARTKIVSRNNLLAPASISGLTFGVCSQNAIGYTTANVAGANSYLWSAPSGSTLVSGQGGTSIAVDFPSSFTNGNLSVSGVNGCGVGVARTVNVKGQPATPGTITGITSVCTGAVYQYNISTVVGTLNYIWTAPGTIISGQGTKDIQVQYGSSPASNQAITVKASNDCGTSGIRTLGGVTITFCVRIGESDYDIFTVYPNPATDELEIRFASDEETTYQIQLFDASGRLVYDKTHNGTEGLNTSKLNVSEFKRGLYLLQLKSGEHSQIQKVILE